MYQLLLYIRSLYSTTTAATGNFTIRLKLPVAGGRCERCNSSRVYQMHYGHKKEVVSKVNEGFENRLNDYLASSGTKKRLSFETASFNYPEQGFNEQRPAIQVLVARLGTPWLTGSGKRTSFVIIKLISRTNTY